MKERTKKEKRTEKEEAVFPCDPVFPSAIAFPSDIRKTKQREEIFKILSRSSEPMFAQEIYLAMVKSMDQGNFAVSTIYRGLSAFEEKGYVEKTTLMGEDTCYYEWIKEGHRHYAVCLECRRRIPLKTCPFSGHMVSREEIEPDEEGFLVEGHRLEIYGYCRNCRK